MRTKTTTAHISKGNIMSESPTLPIPEVKIARPQNQLSLENLQWKDIYLDQATLNRPKFNIVRCEANKGLPHNAFVPEKFQPELRMIWNVCQSSEYKDQEIFALDFGDYKMRVCQSYDHKGLVTICARHISTVIPDFYDPKWGYEPYLMDVVMRWLNTPGYFLILGQTGSGKTQLMFSAIHAAMQQNSYVIRTAEDPVEFELPRITDKCSTVQWEVRKPRDWNKYLGLMMRSAPDIAGCGELRFGETATTFFSLGTAGPAAWATTHGTDISSGLQRLYNIAKTGSMGEAASEAMADGFNGAIHISLVVDPKTQQFKPETTILDATQSDGDKNAIRNDIRTQKFPALRQIIDRQMRANNRQR